MSRVRLIAIVTIAASLPFAGCGKKQEAPAKSASPTAPPAPLSIEVAAATRVRTVEAAVLAKADVKQPRALRVDPNGNVYVVDYVGRQIVVLNPSGALRSRWSSGAADILGMDIGPDGLLYTLDAATMKVTAFGPDGKPGRTIDLAARNAAYNPRGFAVAPDGSFYVVDTGGGKLYHIAADGKQLKSIGGIEPLKFSEPSDVAASASGFVALADGAHKRVVILNAQGDFVRAVGIPGVGGFDGIRLDEAEDGGFLAVSLDTVYLIPREGNARAVAGKGAGNPDEFQGLAAGVAWDAKEKAFYVSDTGARTLKVFKLKT
jgi:DNA-binding beta-propeller fold protein YncE